MFGYGGYAEIPIPILELTSNLVSWPESILWIILAFSTLSGIYLIFCGKLGRTFTSNMLKAPLQTFHYIKLISCVAYVFKSYCLYYSYRKIYTKVTCSCICQIILFLAIWFKCLKDVLNGKVRNVSYLKMYI